MERAEPCTNGQSCLKKPPAKLSLILGMDLHHVQSKLVEQFNDNHGFMAVYAYSLSQKLITAGNRMYPYNEETARIALSNTNNFGVATENVSEEDNLSSLPSTALFHSALQENCQTAVRFRPKSPALYFPEDKNINVPNTPVSTAASTASLRTPRATPTPTSASTPHSNFSFDSYFDFSFDYNDGGNDSFSSVRFSGSFSSVWFSGNNGAYLNRTPAPGYYHHFDSSSSNRALLPLGE